MQLYNKTKYDAKHKKPSQYKENQLVLVRNYAPGQAKSNQSKKLMPAWIGPCRMKTVLNKNRYVVTDVEGFNLSSRKFDKILSPDKLKPWIKIKEPEIDTAPNLEISEEN